MGLARPYAGGPKRRNVHPALPDGPMTDRKRTENEPRTDREWTANGSGMDRERIGNGPRTDRERTTEIQAIDRPGPSEKGSPIHLAGAPREGEVP
jgi:hypothetical protein